MHLAGGVVRNQAALVWRRGVVAARTRVGSSKPRRIVAGGGDAADGVPHRSAMLPEQATGRPTLTRRPRGNGAR